MSALDELKEKSGLFDDYAGEPVVGGDITPMTGPGKIVSDAINAFMEASSDLEEAKKKVPDYTGPLSPEDYYKNELHWYNVASNNLAEILEGWPHRDVL